MSRSGENYEAVIGLEVHAQLQTRAKLFSPEPATYGEDPNTLVDPISLGHPGTLPVLNEKAVEYTLRMGMATNCDVAERSIFARKHYFYPDLPKGYQISQYETPICRAGHIDLTIEPEEGEGDSDSYHRRVGITRIHIEEDAGKSIHDQDPDHSLIDLNRCGVPLIEIVSEPDIRTPREAYSYMRKIRQLVRYLDICDGNMEQGSLRCDANVSVRPAGQDAFGTKTEVKNMNSFRNVERALSYEIDRQVELLGDGGEVVQETRLWDADEGQSRSMRSKEEAHDYRYFPDPDLVQVVVTEEMLQSIAAELPELPDARRERYIEELGLPAYDAGVLTEEREIAEYFEDTLARMGGEDTQSSRAEQAKAISNFVMTEVLRVLNERSIGVRAFPIEPSRLAALIELRLADKVSSSAAQEIFEAMLDTSDSPDVIAERRDLLQVSDEDSLLPVIHEVLEDNPGQVEAYLNGKEGLIGFFIGQVMRTFPGSPDPQMVRKLLREELNKKKQAT
jgi:aspartyl-tRNA(Asn)/glutamyl-tRNA(Gln) amidotransferase subunit B